MSEVMTKADGVEYIRQQLITSKLVMADAVEKTGWTFPRILSRAKTICSKMSGYLEKEERGIYVFRTTAPTGKPDPTPVENEMSLEEVERMLLDDAKGKSNG